MALVEQDYHPAPGYSMDRGPGAAAERMALVRFLADRRAVQPGLAPVSMNHSWRRTAPPPRPSSPPVGCPPHPRPEVGRTGLPVNRGTGDRGRRTDARAVGGTLAPAHRRTHPHPPRRGIRRLALPAAERTRERGLMARQVDYSERTRIRACPDEVHETLRHAGARVRRRVVRTDSCPGQDVDPHALRSVLMGSDPAPTGQRPLGAVAGRLGLVRR
jgi:hypothetical protein